MGRPNQPSYPKNTLTTLKRMAAAGCVTVVADRCTLATANVLEISAEEAHEYVLETIQMLELADFAGAVQQRGSWFDVYGIYRDGRGWFVKIGQNDDGTLVLSHHDPERGALRLENGTLIHARQPQTSVEHEEDE